MPYFMVDDGAAFHAKIVAAGNAAIGLWTRAGAWSQQPQNLTEGFIPTQIARTLGSPAQIRKLVGVELWREVPGGFQFHEWLGPGRQMSRAEILERRQRRLEASRRGGIESGKSRRSKREVVTSAEVPNGPEDNFKLFTSVREQSEESESDICPDHPPSPAETRSDIELGLELRANSNEPPVPVPITSGRLGGERYESNAKNSREGPPPYHPDHDSGYVDGCPDCAERFAAREAWLVHRVQHPMPPPAAASMPPPAGDPEPARHCPRPHPATEPCIACAGARQTHESWTTRQARMRIAERDRALAARRVCRRCDDFGWRKVPPEIAHLDPPVAPCDHQTDALPAEWVALLTANQETASA